MSVETSMKLDSNRVEAIFLDCLFREGEDTSCHVKAEGLVRDIDFHPDRLAGYRDEIAALLD